ncbi:Crp/Fnr family transcriptional regulator [Pseudoteredinibacter isoporae]|uniref:CRP-like cAMP-binding protein n=1 Tax=Pseudoteredinibacter isoporae TaxID=570281 RepID=A0A7X0MYW9_9GAMM|nr:Crp/Fnr family transcriptional regulator [Pseudoteredinibacter isoporae]MBB6522512.1 CRP-like cAMP-binding protein [Pseudoteredinibacter isoporae]NHO88041.1 Crp/Fnr family transcriptional regulator [Pseudoteredinibacter isoporae]NIB23628.1 Crp/Fnr family transcriptional regulator [Pseudoteredinibacter isoporae]
MDRLQISFNWLNQLEPNVAQAVQSSMSIRHYNAGSTVYHFNDPADNIYQIVSGEVQANHVDSEGNEILYHIMTAGDCFGEVAVIELAPRAQTTVARVDTQLSVLRGEDYNRLSIQYPQINQILLKQQCQRLRMAFSLLESAAIGNLRHKLLKRLQGLADIHGTPHKYGIKLAIFLSQEEMGRMLGVSRQSINREFGVLQKQNKLLLEDGYIVLCESN